MNRKKIGNFNIGEEVLITTFNPPVKAKIADMYELPFQQVPLTNENMVKKYNGKNVPIIEVFIDGKVRSFISEIVKKIN
jgi:hypothetical protein